MRPPASRLARCPLIISKYPDYHHVYSYITTSKNIFVPCSNSGHTTNPNTDGIINGLVMVFAGSYSQDKSYQNFGTGTNPAAETKSIGLPADALAVMVFANAI